MRTFLAFILLVMCACTPRNKGAMTKEDSLEVQRRLGMGDEKRIHWDESDGAKQNESREDRFIIDTQIHEGSVSGDFDGDGMRESIWVISDYKNDDGTTCTTHLKSNVNVIPKYNWKACITRLHNINDINGDGADDLYLDHWGSMGNTHFVSVMSLSKSGQWYYSVDEFRCMGEDDRLRVKKSGDGVIIRYNGGEDSGDPVADYWAEHEKFVKPKWQ